MHWKLLLLVAAAGLGSVSAAGSRERVLGVYVFHRHGDRSAKAWKPVNLTALGAEQVHSSGVFYRARYVAAPDAGPGLSADTAVPAQLAVTAPRDAVLHASAVTFLQGLYPPSGRTERLANGSAVQAPLGGYQYVPVDAVSDAATPDAAEGSAWLQGGCGCARAEVSSNSYFASADYRAVYGQSAAFYRSLLPVISGTYGSDDASFENGYSIFDLVNVATIHNASIPSSSLLTPATLARLYHLASVHEWNLAYNASEPVRAIAGSVLAGQVVDALGAIVDAKPSAPRFNAQFGAYGTFMAFFGLARLPAASPDFYGICQYASSMVFELVTTAPDAKPAPDDISVRFLFANGTAAENGLKPFPLFGQDKVTLKWHDFKAGMSKFAVANSRHWCQLCGSNAAKCAFSDSTGPGGNASTQSSGGSGSGSISKPVAGVIGALVTLGVILGVQSAVMIFGGLRLVKKPALAGRCGDMSEIGGIKTLSRAGQR